ncbi:unknown [Crocosphaera subtropica ATCC 51142]|uniref:Nuclear transport factor 2 family protein n=1 Tax=Crocosphaera subtropica (strain ATCC 51142 / BH68) TaxID=43989 RepID=B1WVP6_CROS5|nr:nuclear transport factor 2 family protein [Crocosphaera subtropica]ACB50633.1 unknown [Crocosphaera subtropica ATCC 51142]
MIYRHWFLSVILGLGISLGTHSNLRAESPDTAPVELKALITQIDAAANRQDLERIKSLYSDQYVTADGLMLDKFTQGLQQLWKKYPDLNYTTELLSWEKNGTGWIAETLTTLKGTHQDSGRKIQLEGKIKSRQTFQGDKLIRQEILSEETRLTSGEDPPEVTVNLPETVKVGESFDFDVIVSEPLSDDLLAGMAMSEQVESNRYLDPATMQLELLQSGGLFKRISPIENPQNRWLSAILVRSGGITIVTHRVRIVE